jgi:hypothetical protein
VDADGVLDEALVRLGSFGPEFGGGLSSHGSMVVEALVRLGRADAVGRWVDDYVHRLEPAAEPSGRAATLGDITTVGDWERRFAGELDAARWTEVVGRWLPQLLPGVMAAATHGWLRTAHAARALRAHDTPARRAELARGLAYWAARYQELPGPTQPTGTRSLAAAVSSLPARPGDGPGLIFEQVRALDGDADFVAVVDSAEPSALTFDSLLATAATVIRAGNAEAPIVYVHTLTPTAALRSLAGILDASSLPLALGCTWRAVAALIATYPVARGDPGEAEEVDAADVVDRAVTGGDEHAIKVAEAAFGPDATPDPNVRAAAAALVARLQPAA